jgi:hypothetical protein
MQRIIPKISLLGWILWFILSLFDLFSNWPGPNTSIMMVAILWAAIGIRGAGIVLSALLCQRPNRPLAFIFTVVCVFAMWKFYVGDIVFHMAPLGGLTFSQAVVDWWHRSTTSPAHFIRVIAFALFLSVSIVCWPLYGIIYGTQSKNSKD